EKRRAQAVERVPFPSLAIVLNSGPYIIIAVSHAENFVLFKQTDENTLSLCRHLPKHTRFIGFQPLAIVTDFLPPSVLSAEKNRVCRRYIGREGVAFSEAILHPSKPHIQQQFS